jgi:hypothetical protein
MNNLWLDIRYAARQLRKSPGFTLAAVLTLAFGIGATTAIFSIVEGVLLRPLPFQSPERLMVLSDVLEGAEIGVDGDDFGVTAPETRTYARETKSFSSLGGYRTSSYELSGVGDPAQINAARLTASVFPRWGFRRGWGAPLRSRKTRTASKWPSSATRCGADAFMATRTSWAKRFCWIASLTRSSV